MPRVSVGVLRENYHNFKLQQITDWKLKFSFLPRKSHFSKKQLFGRYAYRGICMITGPGDPVIYEYWMSKEDFIVWQLTK